MNDQEALEQVGEILSDGWCKGALHRDVTGNITTGFAADREASCLLGGIELVAQDQEQLDRLQKRVIKGIRRLREPGGFDFPISIPAFNDSDETTKEDALLAVKYAAEEDDG
jgi:hypothetical protein